MLLVFNISRIFEFGGLEFKVQVSGRFGVEASDGF